MVGIRCLLRREKEKLSTTKGGGGKGREEVNAWDISRTRKGWKGGEKQS